MILDFSIFLHRSDESNNVGTEDQATPSKKAKITSATGTNDISDINHSSSDTEKYKILTHSQTFPTGFKFPKEQFGTTKLGKPHMRSFNPNWLEEFKTDGLIYSVTEDGAKCKYCKLFPGGERGLLVRSLSASGKMQFGNLMPISGICKKTKQKAAMVIKCI